MVLDFFFGLGIGYMIAWAVVLGKIERAMIGRDWDEFWD